MNVDQVPDADIATLPGRTLAVEVRSHVHGAAHVEIPVDATTQLHPAVHCTIDEHKIPGLGQTGGHLGLVADLAGGVEGLVKAEDLGL